MMRAWLTISLHDSSPLTGISILNGVLVHPVDDRRALAFCGCHHRVHIRGHRIEEQDLVSFHGEQYRPYQTQVPMIVPGLKLPSSDDKAKSAEQA